MKISGLNVLSLFDGKYEISSTGEVYSNARKEKVELKGKVGKHGYREVLLTVKGKRVYKLVHRLVAEQFVPNPLNLPEVNHKDGNKLNNHFSNLEWVTSSLNSIHSRDCGLQKYKIDMKIANEIRNDVGSNRKLAVKYGISKTQIGLIKQNKRWAA